MKLLIIILIITNTFLAYQMITDRQTQAKANELNARMEQEMLVLPPIEELEMKGV